MVREQRHRLHLRSVRYQASRQMMGSSCPALCRGKLGGTVTQIGTADPVPGADSDEGAKPSRVNLPSTEFFDGFFEGFRSPTCF